MTQKEIDKYRDEYMGTVFGASALAFVAITEAYDALDLLAERRPDIIRGEVKRHVNALTGGGCGVGSVAKVRSNIADTLQKDRTAGMSWMDDFGNAVYGGIETDIMRLRHAIANELGRYPKVPDFNAVAVLLVAQSLANEQRLYCERRAKAFRGFSMKIHRGGAREPVSMVLRRLSCEDVDFHLTRLAALFLENALPDGADLAGDTTIRNGCKAILNKLADTSLWERARDKADELNS